MKKGLFRLQVDIKMDELAIIDQAVSDGGHPTRVEFMRRALKIFILLKID